MSSAGPVWPLHQRERKTLLLVGDVIVLLVSVALALLRWITWDEIRTFDLEWFLWVPVWVLAIALTGGYELRIAGSPFRIIRSLAGAAALVLGLYAIVYFFAPPESLPRSVVLIQSGLAAAGLTLWRSLYSKLLTRSRFRHRVLIVGTGRSARAVVETIEEHGASSYEIVVGSQDGESGSVEGELRDTVARERVSEVVVATEHPLSSDELASLLLVQERGIRITPMPLLFEALTAQVPVDHLGSNWWGTLPLDHPQTRALYSLAKRTLDLMVALPSLVVFGLLLPFLATAIKLDSKGPVFYRQRRVGKHGRPFEMVKLRTMVVDAEPEGRAVWATDHDPRITRVGRLLRATMLDEIPQLWNVVKGEMSIVGPRPERPELVAELETKIPYYRLRHAAAPGMAGWSLLHEGYSGTAEKALTKLQYDLYYIKHQSLWLDLQIILRTLGRGLTFRRSERKTEDPGAAR